VGGDEAVGGDFFSGFGSQVELEEVVGDGCSVRAVMRAVELL
jgi:hypothetical protein